MNDLQVYPSMTRARLYQHFTEHFPYLRLHLIRPEETLEANDDELGSALPLPTDAKQARFCITGSMTVSELETNFRRYFGIIVIVYRRMGFAWHDTDDTRHWTLTHQNRKGAQVCDNSPVGRN
ncbi:hypothetical protein JYG30_12450 [Fibrella sp. USSR17]